MKINNDLIDKIYNNDPKKRIKLKSKSDINKLSEYQEIIPMYDIYSEKVYPIYKENIYYRLLYCHYRFINQEIKAWIENKYKKNKEKHSYNIDIISNYNIEILLKTSYETLYRFSPELGLSISICKRNSFNRYFKYLTPYYTKNELLKLGLNMGVITDINSIDINNVETHYTICKKISKNDISSEEILSHNKFIIDNDLISIISNFSFLGSYYMNEFLRNNQKNGNNLMIESINKLAKLMVDTPPLKNDYYLYRFIWDDFFIKDLKKGDVFMDKGFTSTTRDPFYSPGLKSNFGLVLIKIKIPANKNVGLLIENFSLFPKEEEFLLPPYSKFKLLSKDDNFKYYHINSDFEKLITRKYEFEYVGNNFKRISLIGKDNYMELEPEKIEGSNKIEIIRRFINYYEVTNNTMNLIYNDRKYKIFYNWFDGTDSYSKFYFNSNKNGMCFIAYDENNYPYLSIEFGEIMVVNYLNQFYYGSKARSLDDIDMKLVFHLGNLFKYSEAKLYLEYDNFNEFELSEIDSVYLYSNLYCKSLYKFLKLNEKFFPNLKKFNDYIKFEFGYWKLNKLKLTKVSNEIYNTYKTIISKNEVLSNLIIKIVEEHFYNYKKLLEQINKYHDIDLANNLYVNLDLASYYKISNKSNIPYDQNNMEVDDNFKISFGQNIRRVI